MKSFFLCIEFNVHGLQVLEKNLNNKTRKQVFLKLISQNGVQKCFFIIELNEINMY